LFRFCIWFDNTRCYMYYWLQSETNIAFV